MGTMITSKGKITIPKQIRDSLDMGPGCNVDVVVNRDGEVVLREQSEDFMKRKSNSTSRSAPQTSSGAPMT